MEAAKQETENAILRNEQSTKHLKVWAQTLLTLINKCEDHLRQLSALAAVEESASLQQSPCAPLSFEKTSTAGATARTLKDPAKDIHYHRQGIAMIRMEFIKVG